MADQYEVATGFDNSGSLAKLDPQPASPGIASNDRKHSVALTPYDAGQYTTLEYNGALPVDDLVSVLSQLGLTNAISSEVTLRLNSDVRTWTNKNCVIIKPQPYEDMSFQRGAGWYNKIIFYVHVLGDAS